MIHLIADRLDLAIDLLTLGGYGLERAPERDPHCSEALDCRYREQRGAARRRGEHVPLYGRRARRRRPATSRE